MAENAATQNSNLVRITVDGVQLSVPKGTNLIEAALKAGIEIPYYCYHPHLSIAGNCRMCQVQVEGSPKLTIACNTVATDGLVVKTQRTSPLVKEAQRATLEFLLINHPLDCTVCDQAGHCKLQDYYYEYNGTPSRFLEEKVHKVKAEPLGPEVIYDGERCIVCTRCVRFCDEVTHTSELGLFNRGDHAVIGIAPGKELTNPLSGTVVDLCPVGALTHRQWRFNTRIWYTNEENTICTGCSTGCNARVAVRDNRVVYVKARLNSAVNKEWMCDEGRYGFERFQPNARQCEALLRKGTSREVHDYEKVSLRAALQVATKLSVNAQDADSAAVFLSPLLTLEEMWVATQFAEKVMGIAGADGNPVVQLKTRTLDAEQAVLISPDYAANARSAQFFGLCQASGNWREELQTKYQQLLQEVRQGKTKRILLVGDQAILDEDVDSLLLHALGQASISVALTPRGVDGPNSPRHGNSLGAHQFCHVVLPSRTVNEKSGVMVNQDLRFQRLKTLLSAPFGTYPEWLLLGRLAAACKKPILKLETIDDRALFHEMTAKLAPLNSLSLMKIGDLGIGWEDLQTLSSEDVKKAS